MLARLNTQVDVMQNDIVAPRNAHMFQKKKRLSRLRSHLFKDTATQRKRPGEPGRFL